jgi:hypothetical protein
MSWPMTDEDTVSLVVDPTLSTLDISVSNNSNFFSGNASAFEYVCYEVEGDTPQFNFHGPVVGRLDMYHTKVLLYRTMVLLARPTKVRR